MADKLTIRRRIPGLPLSPRATEEFIRDTPRRLLQAGAYLQAADGEGVVAVFGFPVPIPDMRKSFARCSRFDSGFSQAAADKEKISASYGIRAGISSGAIIAAALQDSRRPAPVSQRRTNRPGAQTLRRESSLWIENSDGHANF